ncbi:MAG: hypothetical protein ACRDDF_04510 [Aeromonas sp.]
MNYVTIEQAEYKMIGIIDGRVKFRRMSSGVNSKGYIGCGVEPSFKIKFDYREGHCIEVPTGNWCGKEVIKVRDLMKNWELLNEIIYDTKERGGRHETN